MKSCRWRTASSRGKPAVIRAIGQPRARRFRRPRRRCKGTGLYMWRWVSNYIQPHVSAPYSIQIHAFRLFGRRADTAVSPASGLPVDGPGRRIGTERLRRRRFSQYAGIRLGRCGCGDLGRKRIRKCSGVGPLVVAPTPAYASVETRAQPGTGPCARAGSEPFARARARAITRSRRPARAARCRCRCMA